jgi:hypothetical protein
VIFFEQVAVATAFVTSAMLRTWPVRFEAIEFTESVRSFHVPATPRTSAWPAELAFGTHLAGDARHLAANDGELVDHRVDGVLQLQDLALGLDGDLLDRSPFATAVVTAAMLRTWPSGSTPSS